jgi:hypothetical protein
MDVEIASITQLTDSVQLDESQNLLSPHHSNGSDAGMDLDGDTNPSKYFPSAHRPGLDVPNSIPKWDQEVQDKTGGTQTQTGSRWSLDENLASGDNVVLAGGIKHLPQSLADPSHDVYAIFRNLDNHEDDLDDSEWLDSASVRADTQSIIAGDSDEEDDGETGEDDDEMLSGDEAVLAGAPDVLKVWA